MLWELAFWLLVFFGGAAVGSFLNVCAMRLPAGKSIVYPPSHCPDCGSRLRTTDLLPVLSFILLKGRCRYCGRPISWQYPLVELVSGVLFMAVVATHGLSWDALRYLILVSLVIPAVIIDLRYKIIPDRLNLAGLLLALPLAVWPPGHLLYALGGFLAGGGILFLIAALSRGGMGGGDVKLAAVLGLLLGFRFTLAALFLAFVLGSAAGLLLVATKRAGFKDAVPFGPFLGAGAVTAALAGEQLISWYVGFWGA